MIPLAASLGLGLQLFGSPPVVDWAAGARAETNGGVIPLTADEPTTPAVESYLELRGGLRVESERDTFLLRYAPRVFGRLPGTEELGRPLFFQTLLAAYQRQLSERWALTLDASGSAGELSYSSLQFMLSPSTGALAASTVSFAAGSVNAEARFRSSERNTLRLLAGGGAQTPLGSPPSGTLVAADFVTARAGVGDEYLLSRRDTLMTLAQVSQYQSSDLGSIGTTSLEGTYWHRPSRATRLGVQGGAQYARVWTDDRNILFPIGSVALQSMGERPRWSTGHSAGVRGFFDNLNFSYRPVGFLQSEVSLVTSRSFRTGAMLYFSTSLSDAPALPGLLETFFDFSLPSTYALSSTWDLLFGVRAALRGPHVSEFSFDRLQTQCTGFLGFQFHEGTDRTSGLWLN